MASKETRCFTVQDWEDARAIQEMTITGGLNDSY